MIHKTIKHMKLTHKDRHSQICPHSNVQENLCQINTSHCTQTHHIRLIGLVFVLQFFLYLVMFTF